MRLALSLLLLTLAAPSADAQLRCVAGDCQDGVGTARNVDTDLVYSGEFQDGQFQGHGRALFPDGTYLEAQFRGGIPQGPGIQTFSGGARYEGAFVDGRRTGEGVVYDTNGSAFAGTFADGTKTGTHIVTHVSGRVSEVHFDDEGALVSADVTIDRPIGEFIPQRIGDARVVAAHDGVQQGRLGEGSKRAPIGDSAPQPLDFYLLPLHAGETVTIQMASDGLIPFLMLGTATELIAYDGEGDSDHAQITYTATQAGVYLLRATTLSPNRSGAYTLMLGGDRATAPQPDLAGTDAE